MFDISRRHFCALTIMSVAVLYCVGCLEDVPAIEINDEGGSMAGVGAGPTQPGGVAVAGQIASGSEPPPAAITPPVGGMTACTPGERIDTCTVCGPDTRYIMPTNDPECEPVDCREMDRYFTETAENGAVTCNEEIAERVSGTCYRMGYCHTTVNTACVVGEASEVETVYPGCGSIRDCEPGSMPSISKTPANGLCHGFGTCINDGGPCTVSAACKGFENAAGGSQQSFCEASEATCQVAVSAANIADLDQVSCLTYCASASKSCLTAWDSGGGCTKDDPIPCDRARAQVICECE